MTTFRTTAASLGSSFTIALVGAIAFLLSLGPVHAKRGPAPHVDSVVIGSVRYSAPPTPGSMGIVIATDLSTGKELWRKRIYRVAINPLVEQDVQWDFITSLVPTHGNLLITNERGERFHLDLQTRRVTRQTATQ